MPADTQHASVPTAPGGAGQQQQVDEYFRSSAGYWRRIYHDEALLPVIYRDRHEAALRWVDEAGLPAGAQVLEVGCGAGLMTVALARRGYAVQAIDSTQEMVDMARREAEAAGVAARVAACPGDVHQLRFPSGCFDLVVALGVIPWLHSPARAAAEMARVLKPGGCLIVTADNRARLNRLLDPRTSPLLAPFRLGLKHLLRLAGLRRRQPGELDPKLHYAGQVDRLIAAAGLRKVSSRTVGFGPFTLLNGRLLSESAGIRLHRRLQALADRGAPMVRSTGSHYLLLARK